MCAINIRTTYEVSSLCLAAAVCTWDIGRDLHVRPLSTSAGGIDHALVRSSAVPVNLMKSHHDHTTRRNLGHLSSVGSEHLRDLGGWVVGTASEGLAALICCLVLESCGVLLEWVAV